MFEKSVVLVERLTHSVWKRTPWATGLYDTRRCYHSQDLKLVKVDRGLAAQQTLNGLSALT